MKTDAVRQGSYGLLGGRSPEVYFDLFATNFDFCLQNEFVLIYLPMFVLAYTAMVLFLLWDLHNPEVCTCEGTLHKLCHGTVQSLVSSAMCCSWKREQHSVLRLLKHLNSFGKYSILIGFSLILFCCIQTAMRESEHYKCQKWAVYITAFRDELYPFDSRLLEKQESLSQFVFIALGVLLYGLIIKFWNSRSVFGQDDHRRKVHRINAWLSLACEVPNIHPTSEHDEQINQSKVSNNNSILRNKCFDRWYAFHLLQWPH